MRQDVKGEASIKSKKYVARQATPFQLQSCTVACCMQIPHTAAVSDQENFNIAMEQLASISQLLRQLLAPGPCQLNLAAELTDLLLDLPLAGQASPEPENANKNTHQRQHQPGYAALPLQVHLHYMRSLMEWLVTLLLRTQQDGESCGLSQMYEIVV